jgi:hypothetical protein
VSASFVQSRSATGSGSSTLALAYTSSNTAGNLLAYCSNGLTLSAGQVTIATDNNSNTIANVTTVEGSSNTAMSRVDYVQNCNSGANTVTAHNANTDNIILQIWELAGCATTGQPRDSGTVSASITLSVNTVGSSSLSGDAVIGSFYAYTGSVTLAAGGTFTNNVLQNSTPDLTSGMSEFKAATGNGTQNADGTQSGSDSVAQIVAVFVQAAGGAASPIFMLGHT